MRTLIASALLEVEALAFIDALRDIDGLRVVRRKHRTTAIVEADRGVVVTDFLDDIPRDLTVIHLRAGGYLAGHHDEARRHQRLCGYTAVFVLG
jgi:hypothetical protein